MGGRASAAGPRSPRAVRTLGGLAQAAAGARAVADRGGLIRQAVPEHRRAAPQPCRALLRLQLPLRFHLCAPPGLYAGTWLGLAPWMFFYCSLGAGARELLLNGEDFSTLLSGLLRDLGAYSGAISAIGLLTFVGLGGVFITQFRSLPKARGESMRED